MRQTLEMEFVDQLNESGFFAMLRPGKGEGIQIEVDMLCDGLDTAADVIKGAVMLFSLTAIPVWVDDNCRLAVNVTSAEGKQIDYVLEDSVTTVVWLPLIVAARSVSPDRVLANTRKNMYRNLIRNMQQDGLLPSTDNQQQQSR